MMMMIVVLMRMSKGMEFRLYSCHQTIQIEFDARNEYKPGFTVETVTHQNKLARLEATLVRKYHQFTHSPG